MPLRIIVEVQCVHLLVGNKWFIQNSKSKKAIYQHHGSNKFNTSQQSQRLLKKGFEKIDLPNQGGRRVTAVLVTAACKGILTYEVGTVNSSSSITQTQTQIIYQCTPNVLV